MKYLISSVETYRVGTVGEVEALLSEMKNDSHFELTSFSYKTKTIKQKSEVVDEYQIVVAKKIFNCEKDPDAEISINYEVE